MKNITTIQMITLFQVLVVGLFAGCEGGDTPELLSDAGVPVGTGLKFTDAGSVICSIPSPTGDEKSPYGIGRNTQSFVVITNNVKAACESFKSLPPTGWESLVGGIDCSDPAKDFQGATGISWCISTATPETDGAGRPVLSYDNSDCVTSGGLTQGSQSVVTCKVTGMNKLLTNTNANGSFPQRVTAGCSSTGVFQGWICSR